MATLVLKVNFEVKHEYLHMDGEGLLRLWYSEAMAERYYRQPGPEQRFYTIVWNRGPQQLVWLDEIPYALPENALLPIMMSQSYRFDNPAQIVAWQFNREFYCVLNHDAEVGCIGFVFYGPQPAMVVQLEGAERQAMEQLLLMFKEEFEAGEDIKGEMLRMLLVRLIIKLTRLAKKQYLTEAQQQDSRFTVYRQYHVLVEQHYKQQHQVQFYAGLLHKSPKTLSNMFALYGKKTPLQVIQERIVTEAKRLFYYTDKSVKEIAEELGFEEPSHFSRFIKAQTALSPGQLKRKG
ncbi:MAG TPA: helix-turn-helix domain-containing protein [Phnomibacter sp.]|nr:helix-turn-helix domain-containing protein [Phnomibacter sp.]